MATPAQKIRRLRRSLAVITALLAASPLILWGLWSRGLPWAVRAGWADAWIREAVAAAGLQATLESASMPAPDVLELRGVKIGGLPPAVTSLVIDRVTVRFNRPLPGGEPVAVSLEGADLDFDVDQWQQTEAGGWDASKLPELTVSDGRLCIRSGDTVEAVSGLSGRYDPSSGNLSLTGTLAGAGPGSFTAAGRLDPPALSVETRRDSLPGGLQRLASRLLGLELRSRSERRARSETVTIAADPAQLLERGFRSDSFQVTLRTSPDGLKISGSLPPVELAPADGARRLLLSGGFDLDRRDDGGFSGVVRLLARLVESEDGPPLEEADLLLEDVEIDLAGRVEGSGILYLMDDRALQVQVRSGSEEELTVKLTAEAWELGIPWRLPWALAGAEPAPMDGLVAVTLEAVLRPEAMKVTAELRGESIAPVPGWSFRRIAPALTVSRTGAVEGTIEVERSPTSVGRIGISGQFGRALRGSAVAVWTGAGETATLHLDEFAWGESFSGRGRLVLPGGLEVRVDRLEPALLEATATRIDLARLPARLWKEAGFEGGSASGTVSGKLTVRPEGVAGTLEADGRASATGLSFSRLEFGSAGGRHQATVTAPEFDAAGLVASSPKAEVSAWREHGHWRVQLVLAGGRFLHGARLLDAGERKISADALVRPTPNGWEGSAKLTIDEWGRAEVGGVLTRVGDAWHHRLQWDLDSTLEPILKVVDLGIPPAKGRVGATFATVDEGTGPTLRLGNFVVVAEHLEWGGWTLRNARVLLSSQIPKIGELKVERLLFPGGVAENIALKFDRPKDDILFQDGLIKGSYGAGQVVLRPMELVWPTGGSPTLTGTVQAEGIDLKRFSEQVGIEPPLGGRLGGAFGNVTVTPERISFEDGGLRGEGIFAGAWKVTSLGIEDPFGPDTSYQATMTFEDINLRHVSRYLLDSKITRHGVIHGRARGELKFKTLHDGSLEDLELWVATFQKPGVDQFVYRDGAQTLARLFGRADLAVEMEQLPERPNYYGLAMYARMDLDRKVHLRGGYFKPRPGEKAELHTLEEVRGKVEKGRRYFFIGSGLYKVDLDEEMVKEPIPWEAFRGRLAE